MEELRWATANRWAGPRSAGLFTAGNWETSIGGIVTSSFKKHLVATHLQKNVSTGNSHKCPQREGKHTNYPKMFETTKLQANMLKKCLTFCKRSTSNCPQWNTKMPNKKNQHGKKQKKNMVFTAIHDDFPHLSLLRFTRQQLIIPEVPGQQNTWKSWTKKTWILKLFTLDIEAKCLGPFNQISDDYYNTLWNRV